MPIAEITVEELEPAMAGGAVVLDVRELHEWIEVRVPGVTLIPLGDLPARMADIPDAETVYVICRSGARSLRACELLVAEGRDAVNVAGGTLAWVAGDRPAESGPA